MSVLARSLEAASSRLAHLKAIPCPSEGVALPDSLRPTAEETETDFEDDSDFEEEVAKIIIESSNPRRRSQTTISSFDEISTPRSSNSFKAFDLRGRPSVEGPRGPHLFRASQISAEFAFDHALQLSPLHPKPAPFSGGSAPTGDILTPFRSIGDTWSMKRHTSIDSSYEHEIRQWSTQEVIDWMFSAGVDASIIESLEIHDVDGDVLLDLQFEDLRELDIASFGRRHQLWNAILALRGVQPVASIAPTPFEDVSRPCTANSLQRTLSRAVHEQVGSNDDQSARDRRRRGRKPSKRSDIVTPAESVSIVAIEQLLPKPHKCNKGERCAKWRKQQRELEQLEADDGLGRFPVSPTRGGRIHVAGDPGNALTANNLIPNVRMHADINEQSRPQSTMVPSVVASSDLLGPGELPTVSLDPESLNRLERRDPQANVLQFLEFQHITTSVEPPLVDSCEELVQDPGLPSSPAQCHETYPLFTAQELAPAARQQLRDLPRLDIPGSSATVSPGVSVTIAQIRRDSGAGLSICRNATASPECMHRFGTPASEIDVPIAAAKVAAHSRDASRSVPPNMHYHSHSILRSNSRTSTTDRPRPSLTLPAVLEGDSLAEINECHSSRSSQETTVRTTSFERSRDPAHFSPQVQRFGYGADCAHAGWMKKRKTKMLRHEWQDAHFRLKGTQLAMHSNARLSAALVDLINVDEYSVACSSNASNSKLGAAMKALHIRNGSESKKNKDADATAFAFQLVPTKMNELSLGKSSSSKTHHFAVKNKDERIDWMRELMLAKAVQQKGKGYEVEINGVNA